MCDKIFQSYIIYFACYVFSYCFTCSPSLWLYLKDWLLNPPTTGDLIKSYALRFSRQEAKSEMYVCVCVFRWVAKKMIKIRRSIFYEKKNPSEMLYFIWWKMTCDSQEVGSRNAWHGEIYDLYVGFKKSGCILPVYSTKTLFAKIPPRT